MNYLEKFNDIDTFVFDIDGVLTNSDLIITENGDLLRTMNTRDGYAIKRALQEGYHVCIITGGNSKGVEKRLRGLGVTRIFSAVKDKVAAFEEFSAQRNVNPDNVLFMGDDLPDLPLLKKVGLPACPQDAARELLEYCHYISPAKGGRGCVRDVISKVMILHGKWG